jgi:hypothetical protein
MSTELAVVPYQDIERMANALVASNLFGIKNKEQAVAMMLVAQAEGLHPATVAVDYDFIQGRPAKKPIAMLRDFIKHGGKVEWHAMDDTQAEATFSHQQGGSVRVRWDMKKATTAGLTSKEMWKKYPSAMLRSRCVSEGLRAVFPAATGGLYTPEEQNDIEPRGTVVNPRPDDMKVMDEERKLEYADVLKPMLDAEQRSMSKPEAARHCLKFLNLWDELTQDEQIQVHDLFNTKQKNKLKAISALDRSMLKREAETIEGEAQQVVNG